MVKRVPRTPPRRLPAGERREALLAAALPVFAVRGYEGATTRDLAAAAGVTEPVLYHIRRRLPFVVAGGFDLSPLVLMIGIQFTKMLVVKSLYDLSGRMHGV